MIVDLHNHTSLCNHASGNITQYIEIAIKNGVKYFGFSDHAPMDYDPKYRMNFNDMKNYELDVQKNKAIYKNKKIFFIYNFIISPVYFFLDDKRTSISKCLL